MIDDRLIGLWRLKPAVDKWKVVSSYSSFLTDEIKCHLEGGIFDVEDL